MNSFRIFGILFFVGFSWAQQETAKDIVILPSRIPRPVCTKLNEVYFTNPTPCPQDCANLNQECLIKSLALPGCFCPEGFVRNENNDCVEGNSYCGKCDVNEYYSESGPACEECEYVGKECDRQTFAIPRGCFCIEGYARDDNYKCIPVEQCQAQCPEGQAYTTCGGCEGTCQDQTPICLAVCLEGCFCKAGYVKENGTCIPLESCPKPTCGEGEVWKDCGSCEGKCGNKLTLCTLECKPAGCYCASGYVRENGVCIKRESCPQPQCPEGQIYSTCGGCDGTCKEQNPLCLTVCREGCFCKAGYVKENGTCIPFESCPKSVCGENEELRQCGKCEGICGQQLVACNLRCGPSECSCKAGYVRENGKCILPEECPKPQCPEGQVYSTCGGCDGTCEEQYPICLAVCREGCVCKPGYVKENGICIPFESCPQSLCPDGEEWRECGSCEGTCTNENVLCTMECKPAGCYCAPGYVRHEGKCIKTESCPSQCDAYEEWLECGHCENMCGTGGPKCPDECRSPGCHCIPGYIRDQNLNCIPEDQCPQECPENSSWQQCGSCEGSCSNHYPWCVEKCQPTGCYCDPGYVRQKGVCIAIEECPNECPEGEAYTTCGGCDGSCKEQYPICLDVCREGCFCKPGYVKENGTCIPYESCPQNPCGENEELRQCGKCEGKCGQQFIACSMICGPSECSCKAGYVRENGKCILAEECPKPQCPEGQVYSTCGGCDGSCKEQYPICLAVCREGCFCKPGYVKDNGTCIPYESCPQNPCGENEELRQCGKCEGTCGQQFTACSMICGPSECSCKADYVRENGKCILPEQCPNPTCGEGEVWRDCGTCEGRCGQELILCASGCAPAGCYCAPGYVRENGVCIPLEKCPTPAQCPDGQEYRQCGKCDGTCQEQYPICTKECKPAGCYCMDGYVKDNNGNCIKYETCPVSSCREGEVYMECGGCEAACGPQDVLCTADCKPGCYCDRGYVRNEGKCIPAEKCPPCFSCPKGEQWTDCGGCEGSCKNRVPFCFALVCLKPGCYCSDGYVRENGTCIPYESCPQPKCEDGEEYTDCGGCEASCSNQSPLCTRECKPAGCYCKNGYVRENGKCIPVEKCPATTCNDGEEWNECGGCEGECGQNLIACTLECKPAGCYCKSGYVRYNGICIPLEKCPQPTCSDGEVYTGCGRCEGSCSTPNPICTLQCRKAGCYCKPGYVRENGICIEVISCPAQCNNGEKWTDCGGCEGSCKEQYPICLAVCQPEGCYCDSGYVRENGTCIPYESCPKPTCDSGEQYLECGGCEGACGVLATKCTTVCRPPGCYCMPGYVRSNGKCILSSNCPRPTLATRRPIILSDEAIVLPIEEPIVLPIEKAAAQSKVVSTLA